MQLKLLVCGGFLLLAVVYMFWAFLYVVVEKNGE